MIKIDTLRRTDRMLYVVSIEFLESLLPLNFQ